MIILTEMPASAEALQPHCQFIRAGHVVGHERVRLTACEQASRSTLAQSEALASKNSVS